MSSNIWVHLHQTAAYKLVRPNHQAHIYMCRSWCTFQLHSIKPRIGIRWFVRSVEQNMSAACEAVLLKLVWSISMCMYTIVIDILIECTCSAPLLLQLLDPWSLSRSQVSVLALAFIFPKDARTFSASTCIARTFSASTLYVTDLINTHVKRSCIDVL